MRTALVIALVVAACGDGPNEAKRGVESSLEHFTTRMCACIEKSCAVAVNLEMARWSKQVRSSPPTNPEQTEKLMARYNDCMQAALLARSAAP